MNKLLQKGIFILRFRYSKKLCSYTRRAWYSLQGMRIGKKTNIPKLYFTWPHQVCIGNDCTLEHNIYFKFDGVWQSGSSIVIGNRVFIGESCEFNITKSIIVGDRCLIASGCRFIDHDHYIGGRGYIRGQKGKSEAIIVQNDVWLGCNVVILKGVTIGEGAVIAAGAVVTKSVMAYEIWGGVPARKIGERV